MGQVQKFAKLSVRRMENQTEYASEKYVYDSLQVFEAKYSLPVRDAIAYLRQGRVDSISLNKEKPYANFHATRLKERILISIREASKDLELELSIPSSIDLVEDMH
ncbi:MAG TPA: hypothetical protein VFE98_11470 [Candidatus Bathyarchaeia archaeon]|nr:hypothetical protein [Candidatus Bathyarchaeia archaeon]